MALELSAAAAPAALSVHGGVSFLEDELHVKSSSGDCSSSCSALVSMTFVLLGDLHSLNRDRGECCDKALRRLDKTYLAKLQKKSKRDSKKKKGAAAAGGGGGAAEGAAAEKACLLYDRHDELVDAANTPNTALKTGMRIALSDGRSSLRVVVDPPCVLQLNVWPRACLLVGCPVAPSAELENCDSAEYLWFVERQHNDWSFLCSSDLYVPTAAEVSLRLKVYCVPARAERRGRPMVAYLSRVRAFEPLEVNPTLPYPTLTLTYLT